jgi:Tol biopolymer transport system component
MNMDWSVLTGLIAVQGRDAQDQGQYSIFVIDPGDATQELVVEDSYEGYGPRWSPSGEMISFERTTPDYESRRLLVLDLDNGEVRPIISKVGWESVWSPDSKYMLVQSEIEGNGLYIVSVSDGQYWKIPNTDSVASGGSMAWSFPRE